jgi:hypothetical protein
LSAKVGGETIPPTWNGLLFHMIRLIPKERLSKADEARRLIIVNFVIGKKEHEGYRFVPEHGISVQGQDANDSWKGASHIAQSLGIPLEVEFLWRMKAGAPRGYRAPLDLAPYWCCLCISRVSSTPVKAGNANRIISISGRE